MQPDDLVTVHAFKKFSISANRVIFFEVKATIETVKALGGKAIEGTAEIVKRSQLNADALYVRESDEGADSVLPDQT